MKTTEYKDAAKKLLLIIAIILIYSCDSKPPTVDRYTYYFFDKSNNESFEFKHQFSSKKSSLPNGDLITFEINDSILYLDTQVANEWIFYNDSTYYSGQTIELELTEDKEQFLIVKY
tara:strand:- start:957 stop:1307 length:351 start_codon:yes stop_codon:yes gene_type:complete